MERLTNREPRVSGLPGVCCTHFGGSDCQTVQGHCADGCSWEEAVWNRLAAYEDTGLTPEEITNLSAAYIAGTFELAEYQEREKKRVPRCYEEDISGGCRYQVLDGDDEPLEKCKRCPLCYADKQRHHVQPNDPLTLEELREMDGETVWIAEEQRYAFLRGGGDFLCVSRNRLQWDLVAAAQAGETVGGRTFYRRKPEEVSEK